MSIRTIVKGQAGYTLAEMLVVASVIGVIMAGLLSLLLSGQQTYIVGSNRSEAQQTGRLILTRLTEDVRGGGYDPKNSATFAAVTALAPPTVGFTVWNDWNATGAIETNVSVTVNGTPRGEQITYDVTNNGTTLRRQESQVDGSAVTVTDALDAIAIRYLDADDVVVTNPHLASNAANIRTVEITVSARPDTQATVTSQRVSVTSVIRARVRNRT